MQIEGITEGINMTKALHSLFVGKAGGGLLNIEAVLVIHAWKRI